MTLDAETREKIYRPYIDVVSDCRTDRGISQAKLAEMSGLSSKYVTLVESGRRTPSLEALLVVLSNSGARRSTAQQLFDEILDRLEWLED